LATRPHSARAHKVWCDSRMSTGMHARIAA
jgi:hypothetical protein